jgi:hypothetical protein
MKRSQRLTICQLDSERLLLPKVRPSLGRSLTEATKQEQDATTSRPTSFFEPPPAVKGTFSI